MKKDTLLDLALAFAIGISFAAVLFLSI